MSAVVLREPGDIRAEKAIEPRIGRPAGAIALMPAGAIALMNAVACTGCRLGWVKAELEPAA